MVKGAVRLGRGWRQLHTASLLTQLLVLACVFMALLLSTRFWLIVQQRQVISEQNALSELHLFSELLGSFLADDEDSHAEAMGHALRAYTHIHPDVQVVLFDAQGRVLLSHQSRQVLRNAHELPLWHRDQPDETRVDHHQAVRSWRRLPRQHLLYVYQPLTPLQFGAVWSWSVVGLPVVWSMVFVLLLVLLVQRYGRQVQQLTDMARQLDGFSGYRPVDTVDKVRELAALAHALNRLGHRMVRYQQQEQQLKQRHQDLVARVPVHLLLLDTRGQVVLDNVQDPWVLGITPEEWRQLPVGQLFMGVDFAQNQLLLQLDSRQPSLRLLVQRPGLQGMRYYQLWLNQRLDAQGQWLGYSGMLHEVTTEYLSHLEAVRHNEQLQQRQQAQDRLLATISHELRTPLNGILGMAQLLQETRLDGEQQEYARTLYNSGQAMLRLVNDLLDLAKLEAGKMLTEEIDFDLLALMGDVGDLLAPMALQRSLELVLTVDPDCPRQLRGDPYRIRQILLNLASNALKFTAQGQVVLRVFPDTAPAEGRTLPESSGPWHWLCFEVQDSGEGIAPERQAELFQFFAQADRTISRRFGGTGLGLAISRGLAEAMQGCITLSSALGMGSTFQVHLPLQALSDGRVYQLPTLLQGQAVLLIEPNERARVLLAEVLQRLGLQVQAEAERQALYAIRQPNTVVLLASTALDADNPMVWPVVNTQTVHSRVILMSLTPQRRLKAVVRQQVDGFAQKPLRLEHLLAEILRLRLQRVHHNVPDAIELAHAASVRKMQEFLQAQPVNAESPAPVPGQRMTVLLADDNPVNQKVASKMLQKLGCTVWVAEQGEALLALLDQHPEAHLILMDCRMPVMDGLEATRRIRQQQRSIPIVALTANDTDEDRELCLQAGMDDFLAKPLQQAELAAMLRRFAPL